MYTTLAIQAGVVSITVDTIVTRCRIVLIGAIVVDAAIGGADIAVVTVAIYGAVDNLIAHDHDFV
jgi:hypothetical protein